MLTVTLFINILFSVAAVTITAPIDNEIYTTDLLTIRAIVENDNILPDSVHYSLNGESVIAIPKRNTDWYTYMANDNHTGCSESYAPTDNSILWTAPITGDTHEFCSPIVVNGIVYFVSDEQSRAYALNALSGEIIWEYDVINHVDDAVTWYENKVYIAADSAWCLDAVTGERIWAFKPSSTLKMNGSAAVADDVAYFSVAPSYYSMQIFALDANDGELFWSTSLPKYSTGCITLYEDVVFAPTYNGSLFALNCSDGSIIWENTSSTTGYWDSSPVIVEGIIYINGNDGVARAINAETGITIWESKLTDYYIAATPVFYEDQLFFADQVDTFHCLNASDGSSVWAVPGVDHGSAGLADQMVFFGEGSNREWGKVRALSIETGEEVWSYQTGGTEIYSSPAITDGILYIAGMDWNFYAFGTGYKYTYLTDLYAEIGLNNLIVSSYAEGVPVASDTISFTVTGTGINLEPTRLLNVAASPNPFVSTTSISFNLTEAAYTTVDIFDLSGRRVAILNDSFLSSGIHSIEWNTSSDTATSTGLYLCRIQSGNCVETVEICLLK